MFAATGESYVIGRRWFEAKAGLLGLDKLELADQYAPVGEGREFPWAEAAEIVDASFGRFSPKLSEIFRACIDAGHVDAPPRAGKASGAYCTTVSKQTLPFVLMNFTGRFRDVITLAHEFGHVTHGALALERQNFRSHRTGIAMAEVPSTFAQLIADDYLLELEPDEQTRRALVVDRLEHAMAAIFRQIVLARFERRAYALRAEGRTLTPERLSEIWVEENAAYYGDSLTLPDGYKLGWSYIPHFIHVRFYTYAYSFAHLVALLLYGRYHDDPEAFVPQYLDFLATGGAASPAALLEPFGLDLHATDTWRCGLHASRSAAARRRSGRRVTRDGFVTVPALASVACSTCSCRAAALSAASPGRSSAAAASTGCRGSVRRSARAAARRLRGPSPAAASAPAGGSRSRRRAPRSRTTTPCGASSPRGRSAGCARSRTRRPPSSRRRCRARAQRP